MELLPLVEMYCKWELQEDCGDLRSLMLRFDSELELETHGLGRSLLLMIRDDDAGMDFSSHRLHLDVPSNPFDAIRSRIADIDLAFRALQPQVLLPADSTAHTTLVGMPALAFAMPDCLFPVFWINKSLTCQFFFRSVLRHLWPIIDWLAWTLAVCIQLSLEVMLDIVSPLKLQSFPSRILSSLPLPFPSTWCLCALRVILGRHNSVARPLAMTPNPYA